jgi:hypothetical protein
MVELEPIVKEDVSPELLNVILDQRTTTIVAQVKGTY